MSNVKKYIIFLIILIVIIISIILVLLNRENVNEADISISISEDIEILEDYQMSTIINKIINTCYGYIYNGDNMATYKVLNEGYINQNNITVKNIFNIIDSNAYFDKISSVYVKDDYIYPIYYSELTLADGQGNRKQEYIEIHIDNSTTSFEILFLKKEENNNIITNKKKIENTYQIKRNEYNKFSYYTN